jgi:hypothetical protein
MVMDIGRGVRGDWSDDPAMLTRLEAQLAATDDVAVRKVMAAYLSEP